LRRQLTELTKELAMLAPVVAAAHRYNSAAGDIEGLEELMNDPDPDMKEMAAEDYG
jgi:protein subunit release factor A